ncbi:MAG: tRNA uridine-5-carboxymethylaminomethyl(34) synthesis GTPase MnmE [Clostridiales bacterium]|nr:tRNA uridine-5-carboxymethylaminomethyl(34) synthesis GTPase MnmE [Clostridiales bacterium]
MSDLIAAVATAPGRAAIGVLRLSGPGAIAAAASVFAPLRGPALALRPDRALVYGTLRDREGHVIDQALATVSRAPHSYTGEETAELQCHGAPAVLALGLDALFAAGARQAGPGEFTKRAFLNGKLDLTQAEAVADLIDAETAQAAIHAAGQLTGALSRRVEDIYDGLAMVLAHFHVVLDYPDEDLDPFRTETITAALDGAESALDALLVSYRRGRHLTGGIPCAIVGRPNAGKSSLLNALLGYDRAIVTEVPGTTRDTVEERCTLGGTLLRLIDTAGLRESADAVERIGVARSRAALQDALLVLLVLDGASPLTEEDEAVMAEAEQAPHCICVVTKSDLPLSVDPDALRARFPRTCVVSSVTGAGLDRLEALVAAQFPPGTDEGAGLLLTNARQAEAAGRALESLRGARTGLADGFPPDAVLTDVEAALAALGGLTGKNLREEVVGRIFSRFCVGK